MSLYLIKGQYRIVHSQPDGDSVHFFPSAADAFTRLHLDVRLGASGAAQLRLDAIDALETHYTPPGHGGHSMHQPLELAHAAGARLLELIGFTGVVRDGEVVASATPDATPSAAGRRRLQANRWARHVWGLRCRRTAAWWAALDIAHHR